MDSSHADELEAAWFNGSGMLCGRTYLGRGILGPPRTAPRSGAWPRSYEPSRTSSPVILGPVGADVGGRSLCQPLAGERLTVWTLVNRTGRELNEPSWKSTTGRERATSTSAWGSGEAGKDRKASAVGLAVGTVGGYSRGVTGARRGILPPATGSAAGRGGKGEKGEKRRQEEARGKMGRGDRENCYPLPPLPPFPPSKGMVLVPGGTFT